jgi:hypothetical protein
MRQGPPAIAAARARTMRAMPTKPSDAVSQFLYSLLPASTRHTYELVASLTVPINDRDALARQLESKREAEKWDAARGAAAEEVLATFTAQDFPLVSTQGALEKINEHIAVPAFPMTPPAGHNDYIEQPEVDVLAEYRRMFIGGCAEVAFEAFEAALHAGVPEPGAYYAGIQAGRRCRPVVRWPRPRPRPIGP